MPRSRPPGDILTVLELKARGATDREVSTVTGVPVNTIRAWRNRGLPAWTRKPPPPDPACPTCGLEPHDYASLPVRAFGYLMGIYLGDGTLVRNGPSWQFRVVLDAAYPGIIEECCTAIAAVRGVAPPTPRPDRSGARCVHIGSTWRAWACLFPQHGPGRKHHRAIELTAWQREIVEADPGAFLRGLIHTDGWRGLNRVCAKGKRYEYPRYQFSNRSDDIRRLLTEACDMLGVKGTAWTRYHISIAQAKSVALLDQFVGPKA